LETLDLLTTELWLFLVYTIYLTTNTQRPQTFTKADDTIKFLQLFLSCSGKIKV